MANRMAVAKIKDNTKRTYAVSISVPSGCQSGIIEMKEVGAIVERTSVGEVSLC